MRVLITRAEPDASRLAELLTRCGHQAVLAPVAELITCTPHWPDRLPEALIFTSGNAPSRAQHAGLSQLPVFAIGARTADAAHIAGFAHIAYEAGGVYTQLQQALTAAPYRYFWHIGGRELRHNMVADLAIHHKDCAAITVYDMASAAQLPAAATAALQARALDLVLIFSPRSAARALTLLGDAGGWLPAFVLSEAIATPLRAAGWQQVHVSATPDMHSLLASAGLMCDEAESYLKGNSDDR